MLQNLGQKHKKYTSTRHNILQTLIHYNTINMTKADAIVAASTQLIKVLQDEMPKNIGEQKKEQLIRLASIFHTVAKNTSKTNEEKQSITSCHCNTQPRVGETPPDQSIKSLVDPENQPVLMHIGNEKQHNNTPMLQLTSK